MVPSLVLEWMTNCTKEAGLIHTLGSRYLEFLIVTYFHCSCYHAYTQDRWEPVRALEYLIEPGPTGWGGDLEKNHPWLYFSQYKETRDTRSGNCFNVFLLKKWPFYPSTPVSTLLHTDSRKSWRCEEDCCLAEKDPYIFCMMHYWSFLVREITNSDFLVRDFVSQPIWKIKKRKSNFLK